MKEEILFQFSLPSLYLPPFIGLQQEMQTMVERWIYPFMLMVLMLLTVLYFQIWQFKRLYEHIKDDKSVDWPKSREKMDRICHFLFQS